MNSVQLKRWQEDGYLVIPNVLDAATVEDLVATTRHMLASFSMEDHPLTQFTTGSDGAHVDDDYFLTSGDKVRFFFEPDAFQPKPGQKTRSETGQTRLIKPKEAAINKIGHCLHELSPPFKAVTFSAVHRQLAQSMGFKDARVLQSMLICKQPEIGGEVPPHQDSSFLYTDPPSAVGFWLALEDATKENGCLSFAPGSHRRAPVEQRFVRSQTGTTFVDVSGAQWPPSGGQSPPGYRREDETYVKEEVKAGSLVLIHGNVLHKSERNLSNRSRFIYTFHVIEQAYEYDRQNWLQPPLAGFKALA